jgi:hypothetical protein
MRFFFIVFFLAAACSMSETPVASKPVCQYNSLQQVVAAPRLANGKMLCSELYSYSKHGFLAFYDKPVNSTAEALRREALLIGEEDALASFTKGYPLDGQRIKVQGVLKLQLSCFQGSKRSCAPISMPIYVDKPNLSYDK